MTSFLVDPTQFLQGNLFTRAGNPQNFSGKRTPFISADPIVSDIVDVAQEIQNFIPEAPGQLSLSLFPQEVSSNPIEYLQGSLFTRAGLPQNFSGRRQPFVAADLISPNVVNPAVQAEIEALASQASPGQLNIPGLHVGANPYRPGATIRATGPGMAVIPELHRFVEYAPDQAAANLLDRAISQKVAQRIPAGVVETAARNIPDRAVSTGVGEILSRLASRATHSGGKTRAVALGAAGGLAAAKAIKDAGLVNKAGNELRYMTDAIRSGNIPYAR
jgi:hypothetical protein